MLIPIRYNNVDGSKLYVGVYYIQTDDYGSKKKLAASIVSMNRLKLLSVVSNIIVKRM